MSDAAEDAIRRGERAQSLLEDPLFRDTWETLEAEILHQWRDSPVRDTEGRERLFMAIRLLERLRGLFEAHVANGKLASARIDDLRRDQALRQTFGA